jgi:DNA mismatch repair protein MutH
MTKEALKQMLADAPRRTVQIDSTVHLYLGADTTGHVEQTIQKALAAGKTVTDNGTAQWIEHFPVALAGTGSARYTWDKSGNRVKCERVLCTRTESGEYTQKVLGFSYRDATEVL